MTITKRTIATKCPFCKAEPTDILPPEEAEEPFNIFATPPTQTFNIYNENHNLWKPGHKGSVYIWNQTLGITPLPTENIRYWTTTILCRNCRHKYEAFLFEKGNDPKEIWHFLFGDSYPIRLPFFSKFVDHPNGVFFAIIAGILWGLISMVPALISGETQYILHDISRWIFWIIFSITMGAIVIHLKTARRIRHDWKEYIKNLSVSDASFNIDQDSWNFWCNFTNARFEGSHHKITQPLGAGLLSFILLFIAWLVFRGMQNIQYSFFEKGYTGLINYTSYGGILSELLFYGSIAFIVGIAFWVSIDAAMIVIRTFSQFPLKINIFEPQSSFSQVSTLALTSTLNLTIILMIPTSISILSFYGQTSSYIQWILLWINLLIIVIFIWIAYSLPNLWLRCATILTLSIYLLSIIFETTLSDLMPSIPIASIVGSFALSILILLTFLIAIYPFYNVIKKCRLNKINQINNILTVFLDSVTTSEQKKLKSPIELNDLLQMRKILYQTSDFPVYTNQIYHILLLSELPVVSNVLSYLLSKTI